ncbi:MAG: type II CRISPR RNA-guided endonuclease Cas9, partial [Candidatus Neomarinimicrobiota bacterium]
MSKILGLDLGTNSIGWAIIDNEKNSIVNSGVRIFPEGVNRTTSGSEVSKNEDRRNARSIRRQNFRFKQRRDELVSKLQKYKLYPENDSELGEYFLKNPYSLRKKGLDEKLTLLELGRILYHLNERRGFKTNRKINDKQESKIFTGKDEVTGIIDTQKAINDNNFRTLGEYLASINTDTKRIRNRYTLRKMYKDEFEVIWNKQKEYYPEILTSEVKDDIYDTIFFQRKLKSQKHTVGYCVLEPKKRCIPKSSPIFQYFRILEQVSRIKITTKTRTNEPLNEDERFALIKYLDESKERDFKQIKKKLGLPEDCHINLEQQDKLYGAKTNYDLKKVFGKTVWEKLTPEKRQEIWHTLHFCDDSDWLADYANEKWHLNNNQIDKLLKISLESGYARLSRKAIMSLIPFLEQGMTYDKAAREAGYHHSIINRNETLRDFLPKPENLRNPIVMQTLYELRKVVNEIIRQYGKPDIFRVELLRDLKISKKRRWEITIENHKRKQKNEKIREILIKEFGFSPSREDIQKYILWEECNKICPYTGKSISLAALYNGDFEIEHIIPYCRSLDNSMRNKTLCYKSINLEKGKKTPFEAFSGDAERWEAMCQRVYKNLRPKYSRFITEDAATEINSDFFEAQLRDSAYIAREVYNYLKTISKKVEVTKGMATSQLRHLWGLNDILSDNYDLKNRGDHRHHAVDAIVIANTNVSTLKKLSIYYKYDREIQNQAFPMPWKHFRKDAENSVNSILVSHKVNKRVRGKL